jgi:RNA-dependent RNA polymerase
MAENRVPSELFCELLRTGLTELVSGLTTWEGEDAMYQLWHNVSRSGGVMASRLAREISGQARLRGLSGSEQDDEEEEEDEDGVSRYTKLLTERSTAWWADYVSGCPSTLEETVMVLLDAGFKPQDLPVLKAKLHEVVKSAINAFIKRYRFQVPMSCIAFLVPGTFLLGNSLNSAERNIF